MKKSRIEKLIPIANEALKGSRIMGPNNSIKKNYDGKVSGFGVTVALSGLRPALAMYYNESGDVKTRPILKALAEIIVDDGEYNKEINKLKSGLTLVEKTERSLVELAYKKDMDEKCLPILKKYVLEATTALKQVVRTYELVK